MRPILIALAAALALSPATVLAQPAPSPAAGGDHYTTGATPIGQILDDPAAKTIVLKDLPGVIDNDQIEMARGMTLKDLQQYAPDKITDQALAQTDADLAKIPAKK